MTPVKPQGQLVSIVVPVYNVERYLETCLASLCNQTYQTLEIILVNDGSTDNSAAICRRFASADKRIRYIAQENRGLSGARNTGIAASTGSLITFIDSDDFIEADYIEKLCRKQQAEDLDIVQCLHCRVDESGRQALHVQQDISHDKTSARSWLTPLLACKLGNTAWSRLYKTSLFLDNNITYPLGRYHEDIHVIVQLYYAASRVGYINEPLYYWRVRESSISGQITEKHIDDIFDGLEETAALLLSKSDYAVFKEPFQRRISALTHYILIKLSSNSPTNTIQAHPFYPLLKKRMTRLMIGPKPAGLVERRPLRL